MARRGIAVWDQVPHAGVVRNGVASLPAPSRAAESAVARNAARCSDMPKSSTFARCRSLRGRFERHLAVGSRQAHLRAAACALRRPSGTNSAVPPRCLAGHSKSVPRAARTRVEVLMRKFNKEVAQDDGTEVHATKEQIEVPRCGDNFLHHGPWSVTLLRAPFETQHPHPARLAGPTYMSRTTVAALEPRADGA